MFYPFFSFHQALNILKKHRSHVNPLYSECKYKVKWLYEDILIFFFFKDMKTARNQFYFTL